MVSHNKAPCVMTVHRRLEGGELKLWCSKVRLALASNVTLSVSAFWSPDFLNQKPHDLVTRVGGNLIFSGDTWTFGICF